MSRAVLALALALLAAAAQPERVQVTPEYVEALRGDANVILEEGSKDWLSVYNHVYEMNDLRQYRDVQNVMETAFLLSSARGIGNVGLSSSMLMGWARACDNLPPGSCNRPVVAAALEECAATGETDQHVGGCLQALCTLWDREGYPHRAMHFCLRAGIAARGRVDDWKVHKTLLLNRILSSEPASPFAPLPFVSPPAEADRPRPVPVFIMGLPRSGTTLLDQMLSTLPDVHCVAENLTLDWSVLNPLSELAVQRLGSLPGPLTVYAPLFEPDGAVLRRSAVALRDALEATAPPGTRAIVDKTVMNYMYMPLIARLLPDAVFLLCERDPRDNLLSIFLRTFESWDDKMAYSHMPREIAQYYDEYQRLVDSNLRDAPTARRVTRVQHEQLVRDPERVLTPVLRRLGYDWDPAVLEFWRSSRNPKTASNDQITKPLNPKGIGKWRKYAPYMQLFGLSTAEEGGDPLMRPRPPPMWLLTEEDVAQMRY